MIDVGKVVTLGGLISIMIHDCIKEIKKLICESKADVNKLIIKKFTYQLIIYKISMFDFYQSNSVYVDNYQEVRNLWGSQFF